MIYEINSSFKGKLLETLWKMGLGKKIITGFHNMVVMTLNDPILFTSMRTRALVNDAMFCEEMSERAKLSPPNRFVYFFSVWC